MNTLNIRDLLNSGRQEVRLSGHYQLTESRQNVLCRWFVHVGAVGIGLRGELEGLIEAECARCLAPYQRPVSLTINEQLVFEKFADEDDGSFCETLNEDSELDLADLARQYLVMALSEQRYCGDTHCLTPVVSH